MIVCVCEGVSDRTIRSAIQHGADSVDALGDSCAVGKDCGRCRSMLRGMLGERARSRRGDRVRVGTLLPEPCPA